MDKSIKISVVIGTYNQKESLKKTLESLIKQTLSPYFYEIVVVDSMSSDGTDLMLQELTGSIKESNNNLPIINYIRQENLGRPGARNRGISEAKGGIILLTDADMLADSNMLQEHLKAHDKIKDGIFEGLTYNFKSKIKYSDFTKDDIEPYIKEKLKPFQKTRWSYFLTGNLSIKKSTITNAGMFDPDFSGYGWEDIELGYRLNKLGIKIYYLPSAVNYHMHLVSKDDMFKRKYNMGRSASIFYKKHKNMEIKYYLGMNPLAQAIYKTIKLSPRLQKRIESRAKHSNLNRYLLEEFLYRKGLEEGLST